MYVPSHFAEDRVDVLHDAIRQAGLATLVSMTDDGLIASHIPLLIDPNPAPYGTLVGHLAKANPHAGSDGCDALVIWQGLDGYISPSLYETKKQNAKVVPTWNYVAIHAHGRMEVFSDPNRLLDIVTRLTDRHEGMRAEPWAVSDAPADFVQTMLRGIVGISIPIERLRGKVKMSQNRPEIDRRSVESGLRADGKTGLAELVATGRIAP